MKLLVNGKDISSLTEKITWSGDTRQVARKVSFTIVRNSKVSIMEGDPVILKNESGKTIFYGVLFDIDRTSSSSVTNYLAFDFLFYINNSDINQSFEDAPEEITRKICKSLGIECGDVASTGIKVEMVCFGKKAYEAIMAAYTAASKKNGKKYMPVMKKGTKLSIIEKGTLCGVTMKGDYNLTDSAYKSSLQALVNRVLITDKKGHVVKVVEDKESQNKYGIVQRVQKQEDKKDATAEAKNQLKTTEQSGMVNGISDSRAISGYSILIRDFSTGICGKFYIEGDSHSFSNGKEEMQLELSFENLMDEKDLKE